MEFKRKVSARYEDPLDRVWRVCAERIGFRVERSPDAYASTDGKKTIFVGTAEHLDADDCLAQMILHELCHALVEGEDGEGKVDWGLCNASDRHVDREHACLRLQAYLTGPYGLRGLLAPTTDYREFWDQLGEDPFEGARREPSCVAARAAAYRAGKAPYAPHLAEALEASAAIAAAVPLAGGAEDSLWRRTESRAERHPLGHAALRGSESCGTCAWAAGRKCLAAPKAGKLDRSWPACAKWEPAGELDCLTCGACCREAYHSVEVSRREPVIKRHPELVVFHDTYVELARSGERCAALGGGRSPDEPYGCVIYQDRPRTCREFTLGSANCLDARRRVGLSL